MGPDQMMATTLSNSRLQRLSAHHCAASAHVWQPAWRIKLLLPPPFSPPRPCSLFAACWRKDYSGITQTLPLLKPIYQLYLPEQFFCSPPEWKDQIVGIVRRNTLKGSQALPQSRLEILSFSKSNYFLQDIQKICWCWLLPTRAPAGMSRPVRVGTVEAAAACSARHHHLLICFASLPTITLLCFSFLLHRFRSAGVSTQDQWGFFPACPWCTTAGFRRLALAGSWLWLCVLFYR